MTHGEANGVRWTTPRNVVITSPLVLDQDDPKGQAEGDRPSTNDQPLDTERSRQRAIDRTRGSPLLVPEIPATDLFAKAVGDRDRREKRVEVRQKFGRCP